MTTFEHPPSDGPIDASWLTPLANTIASIDHVHRTYRISPSDFTCIFRAVRRERPDVYAYVHRLTSGVLYLDAEMQAYRFVESRHQPQRSGRFLPYRRLSSAFDRLALWSLPWARVEVAVRHKNFDADYLAAGYLDGVDLDELEGAGHRDEWPGESYSTGEEEGNHGDLHLV